MDYTFKGFVMDIINSTTGHALMCRCIIKKQHVSEEVRRHYQRTHHTTTLNNIKLENQTVVPGI